jgi:hypothetical protein
MKLNLSRRAALAGLATIAPAAIALPTPGAAEPDRIFAAIDKHRAAARTFLTVVEEESELARTASGGKEAWFRRKPGDGRPTINAMRTAWQAEQDAAYHLLDVQPTSFAGVIALLRYVHAHEAEAGMDWPAQTSDGDVTVNFLALVCRHAAGALEAIETA